MDPPDGPASGAVWIRGAWLVLRPLLTAEEIDEAWRDMVTSDPMAIAELPDEDSFRARLRRSGRLHDGWALAGSLTEYGREWVMYRITRRQWQARRGTRS